MFKDGKHQLYSATRTQIVSRSLKQRIIQRSYYRLLLSNHCRSKIICHAFVDFTTILLLLQMPAQIGKITSFSSSLAVASKLDVKHFPGRNSGLHHRPRVLNIPPSLKLQTGKTCKHLARRFGFCLSHR